MMDAFNIDFKELFETVGFIANSISIVKFVYSVYNKAKVFFMKKVTH